MHTGGFIMIGLMTGTDALTEVLALLWSGNRVEETYEFVCSNCHHLVELPTREVTPEGVGYCPRCGAPAQIEWRHP
jgi:hypothetical protein